MRKMKIVVIALALALVPAGAVQAGPGKSKGKGHAYGHAKVHHPSDSGKKKHHGKKKCHKHARVAYEVRGTVTAFDAATKTLTVKVDDSKGATNHHARDWRGKDIAFDITGARVKLRDANGDGKVDLADIAVGDRAKVLAKLPRSLDGVASPYPAKKVSIKRPSA